eukprot:scaffold34951_cov19-Tisochrysis_lutea.AAC.2
MDANDIEATATLQHCCLTMLGCCTCVLRSLYHQASVFVCLASKAKISYMLQAHTNTKRLPSTERRSAKQNVAAEATPGSLLEQVQGMLHTELDSQVLGNCLAVMIE